MNRSPRRPNLRIVMPAVLALLLVVLASGCASLDAPAAKLPALKTVDTAIFANVFGYAVEDYVEVVRVLEDAGRSSVPFTTGVLIGLSVALTSAFDTPLSAANLAVIGSMVIGAFLGYLNEAGGNYWSATNDGYHASALSYIPETAWNDSCASSIRARA